MDLNADVVIIGAGAAGLAAAIELQSTNLTFLVPEARNRIGGRAHTDQETFISTPIDLGASWIHSYGPNNVLYNYHKSFDVNQKHNILANIRHLVLDYDGQPFTSETLLQARIIYSKIYEYLELFSLNKKANEDQSIEQAIKSVYERLITSDGPVKRLVDLYLSGSEQYDGSNLAHLSAKYWETGSGSGYDRWVSYGYGNLLEKVANKHNLSIRLNTLVTQINTIDTDRIAITIANDSSIIYCRRVIITIPLGCLKRETILFQPSLPDWKREAINQMGMGVMNKLIVQFSNSFWDSDVSGFLHACKKRRGRFRSAICLPPPANILILFVTGLFARELEVLKDSQILKKVMKFLRKIFPGTIIPNPINYKFTRWSQDPLAYGSYSNFAVHSGPHTIEQLAKPTSNGRIQWAGEHANIDDGTNDWSYGCVHSAFQSGQRAAKAIRDELCSS
jgi:monoamine oxidase